MANYTALLTAFKTSVNQRITVKNTVDSIDPVDVGGSITDFADTILTALNSINEFNILGGTSIPTLGQGNEDDVYIQYGSNLTFWKKDNNAWVSKVTASFGINIPDGNLNLQYRISGMVVTVSSGSWYIGNVQYQKPVQTQFTVPNANLNFDRIDAVFADKLNEIHYVTGTASADPDNTKPSTPSNEIIVTYVYVPKSSSGQLPYFADSNFSDNGFATFTSGANNPDNSIGIDGDVYTEIPVNNSYLKLYQKLSGAWQPVFNLPLASPSGSVKQLAFTESDLTNVSDGMGDLVLPFTGGQIALGLISRSGITEGVPSGSLVNNLSGGQVSSYNAISAAPQYGIVYYVGESASFQATVYLNNESSQNATYHLGDGVGTLLPGNTDSFNAIPGLFVSVDILSGQTLQYTIYNSDNSVYFTNTLIGPGTQNGLPMTNDRNQEFIISNT